MTTRELVADCILHALLDAGVERDVIRVDATWEQLGTHPIVVVGAVELRYGVRTDASELVDVRTVGQAVAFVVGRVAGLGRERALRRSQRKAVS